MRYLVELPVSEREAPVKVEIEAADGLIEVSRKGQIVARAGRSLGEMLAEIRPVAENFVDGSRGTVVTAALGFLDAAVQRITGSAGDPVGLGILITDDTALTCAHVVTAESAHLRVDLPLSAAPGRTALQP